MARVRGTDLQILEYFKLKNGGEVARLVNWLAQGMRPPDASLMESRPHVALSRLEKCRLYYTTNFDDFIERSLELHGRSQRAVVIEEHMGTSSTDCEVVKFHGDWNYPSKIVLSESDFENRIRLATSLDWRLRADLLGRVVLFLGYSFRDPNVSYLFRLFVDHLANEEGTYEGQRQYIAISDPSDFEIRLFQKRQIEVIAIDGENPSQEIAILLESLRS
jgi:hypothetical protein